MRLREPFQGYKLSSGHPMFHMAYLVGSLIATRIVLEEPIIKDPQDRADPNEVLLQLNIAHCLVPIFNLLSYYCEKHGWHVSEKTFDTISII